jgi:carboxylesterase type B
MLIINVRWMTVDGGWLQFGTPNSFSAAALIGETDFKCVVVMPAYRVNLFGFLYSAELEADAASVGESVGNHGFWDQRLALEWTRESASLFGGDPANITISGYSAGENSLSTPRSIQTNIYEAPTPYSTN